MGKPVGRNVQGLLVDADGRLVDGNGTFVDEQGRALGPDGSNIPSPVSKGTDTVPSENFPGTGGPSAPEPQAGPSWYSTLLKDATTPFMDMTKKIFGGGATANGDSLDTSVMTPGLDMAAQTYKQAIEQQRQADALGAAGASMPGAPQVQNQQILGIAPISAETARSYQQSPIERIAAESLVGPRDVQLRDVDANIRAGRIGGASFADNYNIDPMERVQGATIGDAAQARASQMDSTQIGGLATALRGQQLQAAQQALDGPSVAAAQYRAALAGTTSEALGAASQARGADRAASRRDAILAISQGGIQGGAAAAAAAAQEEQGKRIAYQQALEGVRGSDVALATRQAEMDSQAKTLNAQLQTAVAQGNASAINAIKTQQAQLAQEANSLSSQMANNARVTQAQMRQQTSQFNANSSNQTNTAQAQMDTDANKARVAAMLQQEAERAKIATDSAQRFAATDLAGANLRADASSKNALAANTRTAAQAAQDTAVSTTNAGEKNRIAATNLQAELDTQRANQANTTTVSTTNAANAAQVERDRIANQQAALALKTQGIGAQGDATSTTVSAGKGILDAQAGLRQQQAAANSSERNSLIGAGGAALAAYAASDERAKEDVSEISDEQMLSLGEKLNLAKFRYKKGHEDDGAEMNAGVPSAQDLEKHPIGKLFVRKNEEGFREVDYGTLGALMSAAVIRSQKRRRA